MRPRLPIVWGTLLFLVGLLIGHHCPTLFFLPATLGVLLLKSLLRRRTNVALGLGVLFWLLLGCSRMSLCRLSALPSGGRTSAAMANFRSNARQRVMRLVGRIQQAGLDDDEALSVTSAMLLGERSGLRRETRRAFSDSGTAHLLALSGLHLGVLYGMFYLLFIRWVRFSRWRWHALPPILLCIWGYALLTGLPVSLVRAAVMLTILTVASLAERQVPPLHSLSVAALVILLWWPDAVTDIGFLLSFTSVFFILTLYRPVERRYYRLFLGWGALLRPIGVSLAAQIGTAPMVAYFFHSLPLGSVFINLLLVPISSCVIYLGFFALAWPAPLLVGALAALLRCELWLVKAWSSLPGLVLRDLSIPLWMVCLLYALLLCGTLRLNLWIEDDDWETELR